MLLFYSSLLTGIPISTSAMNDFSHPKNMDIKSYVEFFGFWSKMKTVNDGCLRFPLISNLFRPNVLCPDLLILARSVFSVSL